MNTTIPVAPRPVTVRDVVLGAGRPKIIVPLTAADPAELVVQGTAAVAVGPDLVEWRVDYLLAAGADTAAVVEAARRLRGALGEIPLLVTIRTGAEGGELEVSDEEYLAHYRALLDAGVVDLLDVEVMHGSVVEAIAAAHAVEVPVVASNHDFGGTPAAGELVRRMALMADHGADVLKIAVMPRDPGDVLILLEATWTARQRFDQPLITMSMAATGVLSRVGGGAFGSAATFATVGKASAPGQVEVASLRAAMDAVHPRD